MDREEVVRHAEETEQERQRKLTGLLSVLKEPDFVSPELTIKNSPLHQEAQRLGIESMAHLMRALEAQKRAHRRRLVAAVVATAFFVGMISYGFYLYQNPPKIVRQILGFEDPTAVVVSPYILNGWQGGQHVVVAGDSLWKLSNKWYRQGYLWPTILRANSELTDPDLLDINASIIIPALGSEEGRSSQDRSVVADGYIAAYNSYKRLQRSGHLLYLWAARLRDNDVVSRLEGEIDPEDLAQTDNQPPLPVTPVVAPAETDDLNPEQ